MMFQVWSGFLLQVWGWQVGQTGWQEMSGGSTSFPLPTVVRKPGRSCTPNRLRRACLSFHLLFQTFKGRTAVQVGSLNGWVGEWVHGVCMRVDVGHPVEWGSGGQAGSH